nr:ricin-type beta-trefoil lectin domain protein [Kitasatospora fiedleri]
MTSTATGNTVTVDDPAGMSSPVGVPAALTVHASDSAAGQSLAYAATGLPAGLSVDASTGVGSGTATSAGTSTVTATDGTGAKGSTTFVWTTAAAGGPTRTGPVVAGVSSSLCLDDRAADTADGNPVTIYGCNGTAAQQWTVASGGTLQALGKCLDVASAGTADKTPVQLWTCNGTGAQVWQPRADGSLLNPGSGRCLDVPAGTITPGTQLQIYACNGSAAQKWTLP